MPEPTHIVSQSVQGVPHVVCSGSNRDVGLTHGRLARIQILKSIASYKAYFTKMVGLSWPEEVHPLAEQFVPVIQQLHGDLWEEIKGIAEGSGVHLLDIVALNVRSEIAHTASSNKKDKPVPPPIDGCTSFSWKGSNGDQWQGQNWDWMGAAIHNLIYLDIEAYGARPHLKTMCEAGTLGKIGLNQYGVSTLLNALGTHLLDPTQIPIHLLLRRILEQPSLSSALSYISTTCGSKTASTAHVLISATDGSVSLEIGPKGSGALEVDANGLISHTNHLISLDKKDDRFLWPDSLPRLGKIHELTVQAVKDGKQPSCAVFREILSDRSQGEKSICRLEGEKGIDTVFSIAVNSSKAYGEVILGRPDEGGEIIRWEF